MTDVTAQPPARRGLRALATTPATVDGGDGRWVLPGPHG